MSYYEQLIGILNTNEDMRKTAKGICGQVVAAGAGTLVGGCLGGPVGALVGGAGGAVAGYCAVEDYDSMIKVLRNLKPEEKEKLVKRVQELVDSVAFEALVAYIKKKENRERLVKLLRDKLRNV